MVQRRPSTTTTKNRTKVANRGDFTGRESARQAKETLTQQAEQDRDLARQQQAELDAIETEVLDPHTGQPIGNIYENETLPANDVFIVGDEEEDEDEGVGYAPQQPQRPFGNPAAERVFTGKETLEEQEQVPVPPVAPRLPTFLAQSKVVRIRVNQDIENMTYGMTEAGYPNNFNFFEGRIYEVDRELAEHMNERGYIGAFLG